MTQYDIELGRSAPPEDTGPARHLNRAAAYLLGAAAAYRHGGRCHVDRFLKQATDDLERFQSERADK